MLYLLETTLHFPAQLLLLPLKEGLEASKKRGKRLGRPKLEKEKLSIALRMYDSKEYSIKEIVEGTGVSQGSFYRAINQPLSFSMLPLHI